MKSTTTAAQAAAKFEAAKRDAQNRALLARAFAAAQAARFAA